MGRKLMRVPLDFSWPLKKVWGGYLNPWYAHCVHCPVCGGTGLSSEGVAYQNEWFGEGLPRRKVWRENLSQEDVDALVREGRLKPGAKADEINASDYFHDGINRYICIEDRCRRMGQPYLCSKCGGNGEMWSSEESKQRAEDWVSTEPPTGEGYQLWETTSEGSPITPVFESIEELCEYAAGNCTTFGSFRSTAVEWRVMLDEDFVYYQDDNGDIFV